MRRSQRRAITKLSSYALFIAILAFAWYLASDTISNHKNNRIAIIAAEEKRVLKEVEVAKETPVVKASVETVGSVLSAGGAHYGDGKCGTVWKWDCDDSKFYEGGGNAALTFNKDIARIFPQDPKVVYLARFNFGKGADGLFIEGGESTSAWACDFLPCKSGSQAVADKKFGWCLTDGEKYSSLAEVSFSQPILPGILAGASESVVQYFEDMVVKIDYSLLGGISSDTIDELCLATVVDKERGGGKSQKYSALRSAMTYIGIPPSQGFGIDGDSFITQYCSSRAPGSSSEDISKVTEEWDKEKDKKLTVMLIAHQNNARPDTVGGPIGGSPMTEFTDKMKKQGFGGLVTEYKRDFMGSYVYQPRDVDSLQAFQLGGSSPGTRFMSDQMTAPGKTYKVLSDNLNDVEVATPDEKSSTVLSVTEGKFTQHERDRSSIEDAVLGGMYYIPIDLVDKDTSTTMSYKQDAFKAGEYSCSLSKNNCTMVHTVTGCAGIGTASFTIHLKEFYLSTTDTSQYAGIRPDDMTSAYTRAGDFVSGSSRSPDVYALISKIKTPELVRYSGLAAPQCLTYLEENTAGLAPEDLLDEEEQKAYIELLEEHKYISQSLLVTPVRVKYEVPILYKVDLSEALDVLNKIIDLINNLLGLGLGHFSEEKIVSILPIDKQDWQYQVKMSSNANGKPVIYKPALISFKINNFYRNYDSNSPSYNKEREKFDIPTEEEMDEFLKKTNVRRLDSGRISCGYLAATDDEEGEPVFRFWFCSNDYEALPKCL